MIFIKRNEISIKIENYEQMFCMMKEISSQMASSDQTQNNLNLGIPLESKSLLKNNKYFYY